MDTKRFPILVKRIYDAVNELEEMFTEEKGGKKTKRHFTPDGHMVGSIGEVLAAYHYGIELLPASAEKHDGKRDGRYTQIKATQGLSIAISSEPDHLLVLKISKKGVGEEIYNGPGKLVWDLVEGKTRPKNGQYQIRLSTLAKLMELVEEKDKFERVNP